MSLRFFHSQNRSTTPGVPTIPANQVQGLIIMGQSNADGSTNDTPTGYTGVQSGVNIWSNSPASDPSTFAWKGYEAGVTSKRRETTTGYGWSVEAVAGKKLRDYSGRDVYIIKTAKGGQAIEYWSPGQAGYTEMVDYFSNAPSAIDGSKTLKYRGMAWLQGESDASGGTSASTYQAKLETLIANVRSLAGTNNFPIFLYRLNDNQTAQGNSTTRAVINSALEATAAAGTKIYTINTDGQTIYDGSHYNGSAMLDMGNQFYNGIVTHFE